MLCYICELYFKIFKIIKRHLSSVRSDMSTIIFYIIYFFYLESKDVKLCISKLMLGLSVGSGSYVTVTPGSWGGGGYKYLITHPYIRTSLCGATRFYLVMRKNPTL